MSNSNEAIIREMARLGGNFKVFKGPIINNLTPDIYWIKWLSYIPDTEKKRMEYFDTKKVSDLSCEEIEEANRYKRNREFARLFKIYGTDECSEEDFIKVYNYMCRESIEKLMHDKLTAEELEYANKEIDKLINLTKDELANKIKKVRTAEDYNALSMVDAYIYYMISIFNYKRGLTDLDNKIQAELKRNETMTQRIIEQVTKQLI